MNKGKLLKTYIRSVYSHNDNYSSVTKTYNVYENCIEIITHYTSRWNSSYDEEEIEIID